MKNKILLFCLCLCTTIALTAQERRLFHVDEYHGNYREVELDKELTIALVGKEQFITGTITDIDFEYITLEDFNHLMIEIPINQIQSISYKKSNKGMNGIIVGKYALGALTGVYASVSLIFGIVAMTEVPGVGFSFIIFGAALGLGSNSLIKSAQRNSRTDQYVSLQVDGKNKHLVVY
ncbi:MAG: hypothetical protein WC760_08605 [Bacteroidia bacterium]|jgi:hypothetical protein